HPARPGGQGLGHGRPAPRSRLAARRDRRGTRAAPGHLPQPGGHDAGAREVRPRSDRRGGAGQARSRDRPRRGDPARDPGASAEGAVDAANLLKPMLARGELRAVGATTLDEYRKHIEKDAALERRFQPILVGEPDVADTIAILRGLKERYEVHHGVRISDAAIVAAATLSERYIADRFLPDKAIDLIDESASRLKIEIDSMPTEIDEVERRIQQLEIERGARRRWSRSGPGSRSGGWWRARSRSCSTWRGASTSG